MVKNEQKKSKKIPGGFEILPGGFDILPGGFLRKTENPAVLGPGGFFEA